MSKGVYYDPNTAIEVYPDQEDKEVILIVRSQAYLSPKEARRIAIALLQAAEIIDSIEENS